MGSFSLQSLSFRVLQFYALHHTRVCYKNNYAGERKSFVCCRLISDLAFYFILTYVCICIYIHILCLVHGSFCDQNLAVRNPMIAEKGGV